MSTYIFKTCHKYQLFLPLQQTSGTLIYQNIHNISLLKLNEIWSKHLSFQIIKYSWKFLYHLSQTDMKMNNLNLIPKLNFNSNPRISHYFSLLTDTILKRIGNLYDVSIHCFHVVGKIIFSLKRFANFGLDLRLPFEGLG